MTTAPAKPQMWLDSKVPKTRREPIDPVTGELWVERSERLRELTINYRFSGKGEDEQRAKWKAEFDYLMEDTEFREVPHFVEHIIMMGALAHLRGYETGEEPTDPPKCIGCHPETWAKLPDEMKARYEVYDVDADRLKFSEELMLSRNGWTESPDGMWLDYLGRGMWTREQAVKLENGRNGRD